MTVEKIETVLQLVNEMRTVGERVGSVWEYTHTITGNKLFAVFTLSAYCDIYESPFCNKPKRIWRHGKFTGEYAYLNEQLY